MLLCIKVSICHVYIIGRGGARRRARVKLDCSYNLAVQPRASACALFVWPTCAQTSPFASVLRSGNGELTSHYVVVRLVLLKVEVVGRTADEQSALLDKVSQGNVIFLLRCSWPSTQHHTGNKGGSDEKLKNPYRTFLHVSRTAAGRTVSDAIMSS